MGDIKINLLANQTNPSALGVFFKTIMSDQNYKMLLDENEPTIATKKAAKLNHILYVSEDVEELGVRGGVVYLDWSSHYLLYGVKKYYFNQAGQTLITFLSPRMPIKYVNRILEC